jgi:hypothetical protein
MEKRGNPVSEAAEPVSPMKDLDAIADSSGERMDKTDANDASGESNMDIDSIWNQIDYQLAARKLEAEYEGFVKAINGFLEQTGHYWDDPTQEFLKAWIDDIDEWAKTVFKIYEEVWNIQGKQKTPTFIRAIGHRAIPQWIDIYLERLHAMIEKNGYDYLHAHADLRAEEFKNQWLNKFEIEAREFEYGTTIEVKSSYADKQTIVEKVPVEPKPKSRGRKPDEKVTERRCIVRKMIGSQEDFGNIEKLKCLLSALDKAEIPLPERRRPPGGWRPQNWSELLDKPKSMETKRMVDLLKRDRFPRKKTLQQGQNKSSI